MIRPTTVHSTGGFAARWILSGVGMEGMYVNGDSGGTNTVIESC